MSRGVVMIWKGEKLNTIRDLMDKGVSACKTREEAQEFMQAYRAFNPSADENLGYISGYFEPAEAQRIKDWFGVRHPIFDR